MNLGVRCVLGLHPPCASGPRTEARLRLWVDRKAALRGAASIACLIGGVRHSEAVAQAKLGAPRGQSSA